MLSKINGKIVPHSIGFLVCLFIFVILANTLSLVAQSTVTGLRFNKQNAPSVNATVMPPKGQGASRAQINKGDNLISGTRLIIPPGTTVILQSPGGRQICSSTQGKTMEYTVNITPKGENHTVRGKGAQVKNTVAKSVGYNYRSGNGRGTTTAARGTEYTFTDMSEGKNEKAVIITEEGSINIIDKVPITIGGKSTATNKRGQPLTKAVSRIQNGGDGLYTSSDSPLNYNDYGQAIANVAAEIEYIEDPEEKADNLLFLGDLYMDVEQYESALDPFNRAYGIFAEYYGIDDLATLEAQLSYAEASSYLGRDDAAREITTGASDILQELQQFNEEDLQYINQQLYIDEDDDVAYDAICEELMEIYGLLGWAYEIGGNEAVSNQYYNAMDSGCN